MSPKEETMWSRVQMAALTALLAAAYLPISVEAEPGPSGPQPTVLFQNVTTIEGRGRTLMPGLIDVHWHAMLARPNPVVALSSDIGYLNLLAGAEATATLLRGFTHI